MPDHAAVGVPILDIRRDKAELSLRDVVLDGLKPTDGGAKTLPSLLLYDGTRALVQGIQTKCEQIRA